MIAFIATTLDQPFLCCLELVDYQALLIIAFTFQGPERPIDSCISWGIGIRTNLDLNVI